MSSYWEEFISLNDIGKKFHDANIKNVMSKYPEKASIFESFLKNPFSLMLYGNAGRGKTYATLAIIRALLKTRSFYDVRFQKAKTIDDTILEKSRNGENSSDYIRGLYNSNFLFIDDFGVDRANDRTSRDMYEIIDHRWANELPTIISTNLKPKEIGAFYGNRIESRLKEFKKLYFSGNDLRGIK